MLSSAMLALVGLVTLATATPVAPAVPRALPQALPGTGPIYPRQSNATAPCAQASAAYYQNNAGVVFVPNIDAKLAYDCLKSVPLNVSSAKTLLKALPPFLEWQSTIKGLKNPPPEYAAKVQPPIDILGGIEQIAADIDAGKYTGEYDFGFDLYNLITSSHDGHFNYIPDSVGIIFAFGRPVPLVSVSEDGQKLPSVFAFNDVLGLQFKNISYTPSPVTQIDGMDIEEFVENWAQYGSLQDRDALYNNVFYSLAQVSIGSLGSGTGSFTGGGRGRFIYPGPTTTLTFANGTNYTMSNYARVLTPLKNVETGEDLAKKFFYGSSDSALVQDKVVGTSSQSPTTATVGYPKPIVPGPGNLINGFYLSGSGYNDVAVLQVPNFVASGAYEVGFQNTTKQFLAKAVADGKKKLIIDVQANGGGTILQGYDMFKQLFPSLDPYGAYRIRATDEIDLIGQAFSEYGSKVPRALSNNGTVQTVQMSVFDYETDMQVDEKPFTSWDDKFGGPIWVVVDWFTKTARWNLSDVYIENQGGIDITGYGPLANASSNAPPFAPENIVLLTDGYCASTCTIFSELITKQGGVKTIALGGRRNENPIQAIGGVKGVNNYAFSFINLFARLALQYAPTRNLAAYNASKLPDLAYPPNVVFNRATGSPGVNFRDGLPMNDSGVALQFIYEEADCRLYWTPEMVTDASATWKAAADAQWGNSGKCIGGKAYDRRRASQATTSLKSSGLRAKTMSSSEADKHIAAFHDTFSLETDCSNDFKSDGFMNP
ncbi:hypothetical protein K491DRAFT_681348 [Lophiostoma macrostomum CBS 122681]|uniref:Uncharacterized protein n=1 Tax=Lophiostoma macrostomum CBS 122681 TaxID=1314788 RepID=A0A6A6SXF8_9PLEO|nr:hypothetical protein K491DRAFT_681348 [Lophiostoma macrostomum CBS 122681]